MNLIFVCTMVLNRSTLNVLNVSSVVRDFSFNKNHRAGILGQVDYVVCDNGYEQKCPVFATVLI
jgi:hypothetical protein